VVIKYTNYSDGIHYLDLKKSVEKLNIGPPFYGDVSLNIKMDKSPNQIVFDCYLSVNAHLNCDRCTKDFDKLLENKFQLIYLFGNDEVDEEELNVHYLSPDTDKIILDDDAAEYAQLAEPMKVLCDEDCKGLCSKCGANLNDEECKCSDEEINPVWEPLQKLKDKFNNNKRE
jgi:uncharacterized protein